MFNEHETLEEKLNTKDSTLLQKCKEHAKEYIVDYTIFTPFYTVAMGLREYYAVGFNIKPVVELRAVGAVTDLVGSAVYSASRKHWARLCYTSPSSSPMRKFISDTSMSLIFTLPYVGVVLFFGADKKQAAIAFGTAAVIGRVYGFAQDLWRKRWGTTPILLE